MGEVQIFIPGRGLGALSGSNGRFLIPNVAPGTFELRAERIGLAPVSRQVTIAAGQTLEVDFSMSTQALGLDEIVVTGAAGAARRREIGNTIAQISVAEVAAKPVAAAEFLQAAAPGIQVNRADGGLGQGYNIRLRGNRTVSMTNRPAPTVSSASMARTPVPKGLWISGRDSGAGPLRCSSWNWRACGAGRPSMGRPRPSSTRPISPGPTPMCWRPATASTPSPAAAPRTSHIGIITASDSRKPTT